MHLYWWFKIIQTNYEIWFIYDYSGDQEDIQNIVIENAIHITTYRSLKNFI